MLINISEILSVPSKVKNDVIPIELEKIEFLGNSYPIVYKSDCELILTNLGRKRLQVQAEFEIHLYMPCDRCLEDVLQKFKISVNRVLHFEPENEEEEAELSIVQEGELNVEWLVYNEILLVLPMKVLCRKECKGICTICGQNLNNSECDCDRQVLDPRMAKFLEVFNESRDN